MHVRLASHIISIFHPFTSTMREWKKGNKGKATLNWRNYIKYSAWVIKQQKIYKEREVK